MKTAVENGPRRQKPALQPPFCADVQPLPHRAGGVHAGRWQEKGQVENQAGLGRQRFVTPSLRFKSCDEMNAWLIDPKGSSPPRDRRQNNLDVFEEEWQNLVPYRGRFDGFHEVQAPVSKTCLVRSSIFMREFERRRTADKSYLNEGV